MSDAAILGFVGGIVAGTAAVVVGLLRGRDERPRDIDQPDAPAPDESAPDVTCTRDK